MPDLENSDPFDLFRYFASCVCCISKPNFSRSNVPETFSALFLWALRPWHNREVGWPENASNLSFISLIKGENAPVGRVAERARRMSRIWLWSLIFSTFSFAFSHTQLVLPFDDLQPMIERVHRLVKFCYASIKKSLPRNFHTVKTPNKGLLKLLRFLKLLRKRSNKDLLRKNLVARDRRMYLICSIKCSIS